MSTVTKSLYKVNIFLSLHCVNYLIFVFNVGWFRGAVRSVSRSVSRAAKSVTKSVSRAGKYVAKGVTKGVNYVAKKAKELYNWAKKAYNKAKSTLTRYARKLKDAKNALAKVKSAFKTGLKVLDYIIKHGLRGIISIRKLWFDVSLGSASLGRFAGGINLRFFGRYNLNLHISFDLRKIAQLAKQLFRNVLRKIKSIFG